MLLAIALSGGTILEQVDTAGVLSFPIFQPNLPNELSCSWAMSPGEFPCETSVNSFPPWTGGRKTKQERRSMQFRD